MAHPETGRRIALIRGINVGRAKRVPMQQLREAVASLGYGGVRTLLNSGNVVFTDPGSPASAAPRIEEEIRARFGVSARVTVLSAAELATVVRENPLLEVAEDASRLLVAILGEPADRARIEPLLQQEWAPEALALGMRAAYLWCPAGVLASRLPEVLGDLLGDGLTTRNWRTIMKIHALCQELAEP